MDYQLENLGPERFQEVCQSILAKSFPTTQCFPVAQRDGGRDATAFIRGSNNESFIVYQIKYVRKPLAEASPHDWIKSIVKEEAPKVATLIPKGAVEYYLLTNVPGTAFPESGSIDIVQGELSSELNIPAQCWWRDDINRRLDDSWDLKWAYPEILSGADVLRVVADKGFTEHSERRTSAIKAFLRDQFARDQEVRFKQVELQNKLLDLYIDVPVTLNDPTRRRGKRKSQQYSFMSVARQYTEGFFSNNDARVGAADFLLDTIGQQQFDRVVIEGAPGQGKSTISQYLCQIHRRRILGECVDDDRIPTQHRCSPVRFPFKVDCRDFSIWLEKSNPFSAEESQSVPQLWHKSLESFLAAQIRHFSGGATFDVSDLQAFLKLSAVLIVFDGLDEVADIELRQLVVEHIVKGVNRVEELAISLQAVVTSRPAAFANSPGLPEDKFTYLDLTSITQELIEQYAEKWLRSRRLEGRDAATIRRVLKEKLDQPHLRELAKNPMQLAILLSLIQTRGGSLPDKRTALYDSYVELFFNRESEKSTLVRDHRDLLIDIHRHLAWILHAEAQTKKNRGSVTSSRLRSLVETFLSDQGHDQTLAQKLFTGMVERVVALVSRVEGTYEFEVQPLREYFAARYLYDTAPYSPAGHERRGTLPDRFDAISRDFFWLNVTRFYAGCYSKGELPSLVDRLQELARSDGYKHTNHPQSLAATLLADWVFAQHPRSMREVTALILDGLGLRYITSSGRNRRKAEPLILPRQSGNEELVERCFELLKDRPSNDFAIMLIDLLTSNASIEDRKRYWLEEIEESNTKDMDQWIQYGLYLGVLSRLGNDQLDELLASETSTDQALKNILLAGHIDYVESDNRRFVKLIDLTLNTTCDQSMRRKKGLASIFAQVLFPMRYATALNERYPGALSSLWKNRYAFDSDAFDAPTVDAFPESVEARKCREVARTAIELWEEPALSWATELKNWDALVESVRTRFGERWMCRVLANISAGIKSKTETGNGASEIFDIDHSLCERSRFARLRAGQANWWSRQLAPVNDAEEIAFGLLLVFSWGGTTSIVKNLELINEKIESLNEFWWRNLISALQASSFGRYRDHRDILINPPSSSCDLSERAFVALAPRLQSRVCMHYFENKLALYNGQDSDVWGMCLSMALQVTQANPKDWQRWLPTISQSYLNCHDADRHTGYYFARDLRARGMPLPIARTIVERCDLYPSELVRLAEESCRMFASQGVVPVGDIAEQQGWFSDA